LIDGLLSRARLAGNLPLEGALTLHLSEVETRRGRLGAAVDLAERGVRICTDGRYDQMPLFVLAHAIAWQGHTDDARRIATTALAMAEEAGDGMYEPVCHIMLGFVDASEGRYDDAAPHFARAAELFDRLGWRQPGVLKWHADAVETYLALDRYDDAAAVTERLAAEADRLSYATSQALAARCRAMLLAHTGDLDAAETEVMHSLELTDGFDVPLDTARTLLVSGVIHRRLRQKAVAREELRRARALFGDRGAALWAARADRELERSAAAASGQQLTSSERSAAVLAASGVTNREIAGRLFISTKTVEAVLTRVYRKLGVRSRTELAHHPDLADGDPTQGLAQGPAQGPA
jgi:DNA-binding CsgD family transcriptional regulator